MLVHDADSATMSGSTLDLRRARRFLRSGNGDFFWFRRGRKEYVVEEKIGAFSDDTAVEVTFDYDGREFAKMAGDTKVRFNLAKLEEYRRKQSDLGGA